MLRNNIHDDPGQLMCSLYVAHCVHLRFHANNCIIKLVSMQRMQIIIFYICVWPLCIGPSNVFRLYVENVLGSTEKRRTQSFEKRLSELWSVQFFFLSFLLLLLPISCATTNQWKKLFKKNAHTHTQLIVLIHACLWRWRWLWLWLWLWWLCGCIFRFLVHLTSMQAQKSYNSIAGARIFLHRARARARHTSQCRKPLIVNLIYYIK